MLFWPKCRLFCILTIIIAMLSNIPWFSFMDISKGICLHSWQMKLWTRKPKCVGSCWKLRKSWTLAIAGEEIYIYFSWIFHMARWVDELSDHIICRLPLYTGVILHELHLANMILIKRKWDVGMKTRVKGIISLLQECRECLVEAKRVLKNEFTTPAGEKLNKLIATSTQEFTKWIERNKVDLTKKWRHEISQPNNAFYWIWLKNKRIRNEFKGVIIFCFLTWLLVAKIELQFFL